MLVGRCLKDLKVEFMLCEIFESLWVLRRDELLVHVSVDIWLITKHILDHVISLQS